ncbi:MAG: hypothetical protein M0R46_00830 [Candidatus Muirbacterium halophilum]|nr:hypothetical protein [Candidatus Muirbacterium halophilum]
MSRFCKFFLIIFLSIIFLEIFLRVFGLFYKTSIFIPEEYKNKKIIVCAGDSFTYGVGVPRGFDYPSVLEKKLNNIDIKVINIGEPGANTAIVKNKIEELFYKVKPEMVIIMAGVNNSWNFRDVNIENNFFIQYFSDFKIFRLWRFIKSSKKHISVNINEYISDFSVIETAYADENDVNKDLIFYVLDSDNIVLFLSKIKKNLDKSQKLELCIKILEEFDFSPKNNFFLKNKKKSVNLDIQLEMDFVQKFLNWCEVNKKDIINEYGQNIASLYFKYSFFIADRQDKLELLLKAIDWDDNKSYIKNIPDFFTDKNIAEKYGNKILNLLLKKIDEKKIDAIILKDISLNLKKIKEQSYNIRKLKSVFESEYLNINPDDNDILKEYSAYLLFNSNSSSKELKKALKWHIINSQKHNISDIKYRLAILYSKNNNFNIAVDIMEELYEKFPKNPEYTVFLAYLYSDFSQKKDNLFIEKLLSEAYNILNKSDKSESILSSLSTLYTLRARNDYLQIDKAIKWHESIIEKVFNSQIFYNYGILISKSGDNKETIKKALKYIEKAISIEPDNKNYRYTAWQLYFNKLKNVEKAALYKDVDSNFEEQLNIDEIQQKVISDIDYIVKKLLKNNIKPILMNYPEIECDYLKKISKNNNCFFIDNMKYFNSLKDKQKYFFPDGHLNIEGNEKLAENVKNYLLKNGNF